MQGLESLTYEEPESYYFNGYGPSSLVLPHDQPQKHTNEREQLSPTAFSLQKHIQFVKPQPAGQTKGGEIYGDVSALIPWSLKTIIMSIKSGFILIESESSTLFM